MNVVVVVMGVAGSGKSTVGARLAAALGWPFCEGDEHHPAANIAKMARGEPLTDEDRRPWLAQLRVRIAAALAAGEGLVVACSALKQDYRRILAVDPVRVRFVYLKASPELIAMRLRARAGHYMKENMLASQFAALEEPSQGDAALVVDAAVPVDALVTRIQTSLAGGGA